MKRLSEHFVLVYISESLLFLFMNVSTHMTIRFTVKLTAIQYFNNRTKHNIVQTFMNGYLFIRL